MKSVFTTNQDTTTVTTAAAVRATAVPARAEPALWRATAAPASDEVAAENVREPLLRAAAWYYLRARTPRGAPLDSVARFHLGNGARLERLNFLADTSERALRQSHGLMVNYLYDLEDIEKNHEAFAQQRQVVAASAVSKLVRTPARDAVPAGANGK